ncbi:hypothetical protein [Flexivirga sp. B27]
MPGVERFNDKVSFADASLTTVTDEESEQSGHKGSEADRGKQHDDPREPLSSIIGLLDERVGTDLTETDQFFFEQAQVDLADNAHVMAVAQHDGEDQSMSVLDGYLGGAMIDRHDVNSDLVQAFLDKPDFRSALTQMIGREFYKTIRESGESA